MGLGNPERMPNGCRSPGQQSGCDAPVLIAYPVVRTKALCLTESWDKLGSSTSLDNRSLSDTAGSGDF